MIAFLSLWFSCIEPEINKVPSDNLAVEASTLVTELGPIKATVQISPKEPKLGEALTLTLSVQSEENVEVELPPFGEALGRFQIVDYEPRKSKDGEYKSVQRYTLQASMSGLQTIPSLRIVFFDRRTDKDAEEQELLTDEIPLQITSLLEEDAPLNFLPARGQLKPKIDLPIWVWILGIGSILSIFGLFGFRFYIKWRAKEVIRSAYEKALDELRTLSLESEIAIDEYYARLSFVLRRYIDARFGIAVLEKTTPEFIQLANESTVFTEVQNIFLKDFLQRSDDVKYAQQNPVLEEGETEISLIRRFLEETKIKEEDV